MRIFSFFLPQFHEIPENDKWWGKGFTEWTNVKAARPIFNGQDQPKIPLNNKYYNLLDKDTVIWQTNLMKKYGIDGFIYYHYYFNGKMLLEKPAENLLKWKEINQPFFFCWANHSWSRSWQGSKTILMPMEYGNKDDWEKHFKYLLNFFKDSRYEKKDNMPLFMLFNTDFSEKNEMMSYFDSRCKDEGFNGLYLIETCFVKEVYDKKLQEITPPCKKIFTREPDISKMLTYQSKKYTFFRFNYRMHKYLNKIIGFSKYKIRVFSGEDVYQNMINMSVDYDKTIRGCFFEWDNTPRHKERGYVITSPKYETFKKFYDLNVNQDYLFINAWNEWCEGMILEPTEKDKYKYLEWISKAKTSLS